MSEGGVNAGRAALEQTPDGRMVFRREVTHPSAAAQHLAPHRGVTQAPQKPRLATSSQQPQNNRASPPSDLAG
jgi:hypothetical protein